MRSFDRRRLLAITTTILAIGLVAPTAALARPSLHVYPEGPIWLEAGDSTIVAAYACDPVDPDLPFGDDDRPLSDDDDCRLAVGADYRSSSRSVSVRTISTEPRGRSNLGLITGVRAGEAVIRASGKRSRGRDARNLRDRVTVIVTEEPPTVTTGSGDLLTDGAVALIQLLIGDPSVTEPDFAGPDASIRALEMLRASRPRFLETEAPVQVARPAARTLLLCFDLDGLPTFVERGFELGGQHCIPHPGEVSWDLTTDGDGGLLRDRGPVGSFWLGRTGTSTIGANWSFGDASGRVEEAVTVVEPTDPPTRPGDRTGDGVVGIDDLVDLGAAMLSGDVPAATEVISTARNLSEPLPADDPGSGDITGDGTVDGADVAAGVALELILFTDPGVVLLAINGDVDGDGDNDGDDLAAFPAAGAVLVAEPAELTLLVGGTRRADAYLCPGSLVLQSDPATNRTIGARYEPALGDDGKAGRGDDACELIESRRWFSTDRTVGSVARRSGLVTAVSPGDAFILPDGRGLFSVIGQVRPMTLRVNDPPQRQGPDEPPSTAGDVEYHIVPEEFRASAGDVVIFGVVACEDGICRGAEAIDAVELDDDGEVDLRFTTPPWIGLEANTSEGFEVVRAIIDATRAIASLGLLERQAAADAAEAFANVDGLTGVTLGDVSQLAVRRGALAGDQLFDERFDLDGDGDIDDDDLADAESRWSADGGDPTDPIYRAVVSAEPVGGSAGG